MPLDNLYKKIVQIQEFSIENEIGNIIIRRTDQILQMTKRQMEMGMDGSGKKTTLFGVAKYKKSTIAKKKKFGVGIGRITTRITNYMTGDFYNQLKVDIKLKKGKYTGYDLSSSVEYFDKIIQRSGKDILVLNSKNKRILKDLIVKDLKQIMNKKFSK